MKTSFSMSSLRDGIDQERDENGAAPATLPRIRNVDAVRHHSRHSADKKQKKDEFWEALQPSYDYLMDDGLIASCKEANGELSWDDEDDMTGSVWTYEDFVSSYAELWMWGEELETKVTKFEVVQQDEVQLFSSKLFVLNEQSQRLVRRRPSHAEDIRARTDALNRLWDSLQHCVTPEEQLDDEKSTVKREIACEMRWLRKWIRVMEIQLGPIYRKSDWTVNDIETKLNHHRVVQKEIESREKNVVAVWKLCQRFEDLKAERNEPEGSATGICRRSRDGGNWIRRDFDHLQKRFHALWLHSLEWQCWLEELLVSDPHLWGSLKEDASGSSSSDEPNRKIPRLSVVHKESKANHRSRRKNSVEQTTANGNRESLDMVGVAGPIRPTDHHDVGYSSESSAHLSNEDGAGEFVRVYTYTSAEATSPRVLEVVMDGDRRPRKNSPGASAADGSGEEEESNPTVVQAGSNCGTFYFCHEDSDGERSSHRQRIPRRKRLIFDAENPSEEEEEGNDLPFEEMEDCVENGHWPDGIHKLVDEAEELVKRSNVALDSSCDASGEYTSSSSSNNSDVESSPSSNGRRGSVVLLKDRNCITNESKISVFSESGGIAKQQTAVKYRTKKRRNVERPSSSIEASWLNHNRKHTSFFNSETALNRGGAVEGRPKRSPRRYLNGNNASSLEIDGKCRSLGSLRNSSSSDNGRWKSIGSTIYLKSREDVDERTESDAIDSDSSAGETMPARCAAEADHSPVHPPEYASSVSEQAWDDFQDGPYFSEPYSEPGVDDEAVRKLMEFGDDYQVYIGSDGASTPSFYSAGDRRPPNNCGFDSESDDMNDFFVQNTQMLTATQLQLQRIAFGERSRAPLEEVLVSVQIHIKCLRTVLEHLPSETSGPGQQNRDRMRLEWEKLVMEATEQEQRLSQLGQLQNEAKELEERMLETVKEVEIWSNKASNVEGVVEEAKENIQKQLIALGQLSPALINLNFRIHDYVTRYNLDVVVLKNRVNALYRSSDQYRENTEKTLSWLEVLGIVWNDYKVERNCLQSALNEDRKVLNQLTQTVNCSPDLVNVARSSKTFMANMGQVSALKERLLKASPMSTSSNSSTAFAAMTKAANRLQDVLSGGNDVGLRAIVAEQLEDASKDIDAQEIECKRLLEQMTTMWEEHNVFKQLSLTRSCEEVVAPISSKGGVCSHESLKRKSRGGGGSLVWRVVRAALPIQLAVVILFCFAYLFEPRCCDTLNNFNLSLTPQLRYLDGPPPV